MAVTVDYLVVCSGEMDLSGEMGLIELLTEMLKSALASVDDEPLADEVPEQQITIRYTQTREDGRWACGFSVEFDSVEERMEDLINNFSEFVADYTADCTDDRIKHLLKLNDPQLQRTLRDYGKEIFDIEMKLREALSLIFVDTYGKDFYELLNETNVTPVTPPPRRTAKVMNESYENEFFHLMFRQYKELNDCNSIIEKQYIDFLASLENQVEWIEQLRNCVAHNRSIPEDIIANYETEKTTLLEEIDEFYKKLANREESNETKTRN